MVDVSVIVPCHNDEEGAYLTLVAAMEQGLGPNRTEYILVDDWTEVPGAPIKEPWGLGIRHNGKNIRTVSGKFGSPQASRDAGIRAAEGRVVICLDSHVIVSRSGFSRLVEAAVDGNLVFPAITFFDSNALSYGYDLNLDGSFWQRAVHSQPRSLSPYAICAASHGAFAVDRQTYLRLGGYSLEQKGWGGEETYLCLKWWHMGLACTMVPDVYHWHYPGRRRNNSVVTTSLDFARNFMGAAYVMGGPTYLDKVQTYFTGRTKSDYVGELADAARKLVGPFSSERDLMKTGLFHGDLDRLREHWERNGIR